MSARLAPARSVGRDAPGQGDAAPHRERGEQAEPDHAGRGAASRSDPLHTSRRAAIAASAATATSIRAPRPTLTAPWSNAA